MYFEHYWRKIVNTHIAYLCWNEFGELYVIANFAYKELNFDGILQAKSYVLGCSNLCMIFFLSVYTFFTLPTIEMKKDFNGPTLPCILMLILNIFIYEAVIKRFFYWLK